MTPSQTRDPAPGRALSILWRGAMVGMTAGFLLSIPAASWVWLEMRANLGLLIPAMTILCPLLAMWKSIRFSYAFFASLQGALIVSFVTIYGFDPIALSTAPASLFREGFFLPFLNLESATLMAGGIFLLGNVLWLLSALRHRN